ncbi:MAG: ATP-binding cassette domain-containing protein [Chloroflexi bacterium]|nr:ATP-binding cassette domain-containing protein [Chloroflexota bacterium]
MADQVLELDRISKRYGTVVALRDLSFSVGGGEVFGFVGSNGAGKTTTMRIVMGVLAADSGEVRWRGRPLSFETRRLFGYMPEERGLYLRMRVREQLIFLAELHGRTAVEAERGTDAWLAQLNLTERANDEVQALSHGNQQRVQLAAALVFSPALLLLDEPFAGLDPVAVDVLSAVLRQQAAAGLPVIFSSHQLELVERLCDRIGIISRGRMGAIGTVDELRRHPEGTRTERLWVDAPGATPGWIDDLPGVTVVRAEASRWLLELSPGVDDQAVLRAALATGPVREFERDVPSLSDLFRQYVTEKEEA